MSLSQLPLAKLDKSFIKKSFLNSPLVFLLGLLCILSLFLQTFTIFIATLSGSLLSLYLLQAKTNIQSKLENINSIFQLKKWVYLVLSCNGQLRNHRNAKAENDTTPWGYFIDFFNFKTLPIFNVNDISFLLTANSEQKTQLHEAILDFNSHFIVLSNALDELQKYNHIYLEKMSNWESKIKTMKALREMNSTDCKVLREKMGNNLFQQLIFLSNLCTEKSDLLNSVGSDLLDTLESYE